MGSSNKSHVKDEVRKLVRDLNQAWLKRRFAGLKGYFHEDMVIVQPGFEGRVRGRRACVRSYEQFMAHSTVRKYKESRYEVNSWSNTAVATYHFDIEYKTRGKEYHDTGREIFVLVRDTGRWLVTWRTLLPME